MTVLSQADRDVVWKRLMERAGDCPGTITKADFKAAVAAADDWVDTNASAFNTALPVAYRNAASSAQKAALIAAVTLKRYGRDI